MSLEHTNETLNAVRLDFGMEIEVRKMAKEEMPDDGTTYYTDDSTYNIYRKDELAVGLDPEKDGEQ